MIRDIYDIIFVMPKKHTLSSLPAPNDNQVKIETHNLGKTAVVKFGGWATKSRTEYYKKELEEFLRKKSITLLKMYFWWLSIIVLGLYLHFEKMKF